MDEPCDLCSERACIFGVGIKLCKEHHDQLEDWNRALSANRTEAEGGPIVQTCPRRYEMFQQGGAENQDSWAYHHAMEYRTCSYCGSMHPDTFMERVRAGVEIGPTDKNYKAYVEGSGTGKFYFQHLSEDQQQEFVDLLNARTVNIGYPGHFYTRPFFIARPNA